MNAAGDGEESGEPARTHQDAVEDAGASVSPVRSLGQILILLQYQTLAYRMKVMVRKAENLPERSRSAFFLL